MTFDEYKQKHKYLLGEDEFLSDKLNKYSFYSANNDLNNEITLYHMNLALARTSFNDYLVVYKLKEDIVEAIRNSKIEKMPNEIPELFKKSFIIETIDTKKTLFGDINSILYYRMDLSKDVLDEFAGNKRLPKSNKLPIILFHTIPKKNELWIKSAKEINKLTKKENAAFTYLDLNLFQWSPYIDKSDWEFTTKDYSREVLMNKDFCHKCKNKILCKDIDTNDIGKTYKFCFTGICDNIMSFLTVFNYILVAENTPIICDTKKVTKKRATVKNKKVITKNENWVINYIYIDKEKIRYEKDSTSQPLNKEWLIKIDVQVKKHQRRQRYGPGLSQEKFIDIETHASKKWIKEGNRKIIISF